MKDFDSFVKEQLARPEVAREYYRISPFYRLADQLLLLRKKRGLSQQELAAKAETTQAVVSRLENATVRCSLETVVRLAEALDAMVEVQLKPMEQLQEAIEPIEKECDEEDEDFDVMKGVVFFGSGPKAACQNLIRFQVDPMTMQVVSTKAARQQRNPEFA